MAEARVKGGGFLQTAFSAVIGWFGINDLIKPFLGKERIDEVEKTSATHRQRLEYYIHNLQPEFRQRLYLRFREAGARENRLVRVLGEFVEGLEQRFVDGLEPEEKDKGRAFVRESLKTVANLEDEEFNQFFEMLNNDWIRQGIMGLPGDAKEFLIAVNKVLSEGLGPVNERLEAWLGSDRSPVIKPVSTATRLRNKMINRWVRRIAFASAICIALVSGFLL